MAGRHRSTAARRARVIRRRPLLVEMVDARTERAHLLTPDALDAGRRGKGRYIALCGAAARLLPGLPDPNPAKGPLMAWYTQPGEGQTAHRVTLARGRMVTDCGRSFPAAEAAPANLAAGGDEMCQPCATGEAHRAPAAGSPVRRPLALGWLPRSVTRWPSCSLTQLAVVAGLLTVGVLIAFMCLAWPR